MSKSLVYAANTSTQPYLATGTSVNFGNTVRRYGCNCSIDSGSGRVSGVGYYEILVNLSLSGTGSSTVQLYKDGVAIPGATGTVTLVADATGQISIPAVIRQRCCVESVITAQVSGVAGNITNASIIIEKV